MVVMVVRVMATITFIDKCKKSHVALTSIMSHKNKILWEELFKTLVRLFPTIENKTEKFITDQESAQWIGFKEASNNNTVVHGVCYRHLIDKYKLDAWFAQSKIGKMYRHDIEIVDGFYLFALIEKNMEEIFFDKYTSILEEQKHIITNADMSYLSDDEKSLLDENKKNVKNLKLALKHFKDWINLMLHIVAR